MTCPACKCSPRRVPFPPPGRAAAWLRLKAYDETLRDCAVAIYAQDDCKAAWLTKAQALHALGRHTEALVDMQALSQTFGNDAQVGHALMTSDCTR